MIVMKAFVEYTCEKCGHCRTVTVTPSDNNLDSALRGMEVHKKCSLCSGTMVIEKAVFTTLENKYGDGRFGSWKCVKHPSIVYYPILLKKAAKSALSVSHVGFASSGNYKELIKKGYPWKCPICNENLQYIDDRTALGC